MDRQFTAPPIATRNERGHVELAASFAIGLELEEARMETTARGKRIHQRVTGGAISGPRLSGTVYPNGCGEFGLLRDDGTTELFTRLMLIADNGEWLYTQLTGYVREDNCARFQAIFDADRQGPHAWLNESMFIGTIKEAEGGRERQLIYYEVT